jgi:hypothetical protein
MKILSFALLMLTFVNTTLAQNGAFHIDKEFKITKNGMVDLSCSDAKVFVTGSVRSSAHIKIDRTVTTKGWSSTPAEFFVDVSETEGGLKIHERQRVGGNVTSGYVDESYRIEIEVPEGVGLTVRGDDGDYYINNINGAISLSLDDADAELADCKGDQFRFRFDDGDLRMDKGRGRLEIRGDDADIEIYNAQFTAIDADVDDGDLMIETSLSDNGSYSINDQDGNVSLRITGGGGTFTVYHDDGNINTSADFKTLTENEDEIHLLLPGGKAEVVLHADDANFKLTTK